MLRIMPVLCCAGLVAASAGGANQRAKSPNPGPMTALAENYVRLVLALGQHDADYVDAYYGPAEWKKEAASAKVPLEQIRTRAHSLLQELSRVDPAKDEISRLRQLYLERQLSSLEARVRMLQGERLSFDAESKALYDAVAPTHPESYFQNILNRLDRLFPGTGPIVDRYDAYRRQFVIPSSKLDAVFQAAIRACRERTLKHISLPETESFKVEFVTGKSWSGYNWYQGNFRSLIQVNTDLPVYIDRAIDLACHEGYPGHHVYNALLEKHLVRDRGWPEFSVYALFSPQSLIAEGTANYGIEVAFPGLERVTFEKNVLFPAAGLDASKAANYYEVFNLVDQLAYAGNEAARRYLNGEIDREAAVAWLERYALMPRERAAQRVRFFDQYRSYVINYNLGKDMVRQYIESKIPREVRERPSADAASALRWKEFEQLLSSPRLPSSLH
jgi:hypothetical protein